jgi:hypothetical protein
MLCKNRYQHVEHIKLIEKVGMELGHPHSKYVDCIYMFENRKLRRMFVSQR